MPSMWQRRTGIQLAYPFDLKHYVEYTKPAALQPKLNGERCRALVHKKYSLLLSSEENEITTMPHINKALENLNLTEIELDGELYKHGLSKQLIGSYIRRNSVKEGYENISLNIFDLILTDVMQKERLNLLYSSIKPLVKEDSGLVLVDTHIVNTYNEVATLLSYFVSSSYEGIILRELSACYVRKRTWNMMKWKPRRTDSYLIIGYKEMEDQYGRPKGTLGSLLCAKDNSTFSVGSGTLLDAPTRAILWNSRDTLSGKYARIKYPELTDRGIPNHPTIVGITDKEIEDDD